MKSSKRRRNGFIPASTYQGNGFKSVTIKSNMIVRPTASKIVWIEAHYRNLNLNKAITLILDGSRTDLDIVKSDILSSSAKWEIAYNNAEFTIAEAFNTLDELSKPIGSSQSFAQQDIIIILSIIYWLEQTGHIKSDEFNGMVIHHSISQI